MRGSMCRDGLHVDRSTFSANHSLSRGLERWFKGFFQWNLSYVEIGCALYVIVIVERYPTRIVDIDNRIVRPDTYVLDERRNRMKESQRGWDSLFNRFSRGRGADFGAESSNRKTNRASANFHQADATCRRIEPVRCEISQLTVSGLNVPRGLRGS